MRITVSKLLATAALVLLCVACTKPEPPDKEQPVEPQADATDTTGG